GGRAAASARSTRSVARVRSNLRCGSSSSERCRGSPRSNMRVMPGRRSRRRDVVVLSAALACASAWCSPAFALNPALDVSQYAHTAWKIRDGFVKGGIRAIAQTPDGYLWLGTEFGLFRFDGVRTTPWAPPPGQHLPSSYVDSLLVARDGAL